MRSRQTPHQVNESLTPRPVAQAGPADVAPFAVGADTEDASISVDLDAPPPQMEATHVEDHDLAPPVEQDGDRGDRGNPDGAVTAAPSHADDGLAPPEPPAGVEPASVELVGPGDRDGLAAVVLWSLGLGDSPTFDDHASSVVAALQRDAGLEVTGRVDAMTLALVLPDFGAPDAPAFGPHVAYVRHLLGMRVSPRWDAMCTARVVAVQRAVGLDETGVCTRSVREVLLGLA